MNLDRTVYYHVVHMGDRSDLTREYERAFRDRWMCTKYWHFLGEPSAIDLYLDHEPHNTPLNTVPLVAGYARIDFLQTIGIDLFREHFYIGRVVNDKGVTCDDFVSFRGKHWLLIRGNERSTYRRCEACGGHLYFPIGDHYLLADRLTDAPLYGCNLGGFIADEEVYKRITNRKWELVEFVELPVLDKPQDGHDDLPL